MTHDSGLSPWPEPPAVKFHGAPIDRLPLLKRRECPICGLWDEHARIVHELRDFQFFCDGDAPRVTLTDVLCPQCCAIYRNPTFTARGMIELFKKAGQSYGSAMPVDRVAEQVAWMRAHGCEGAILDYGCGDGRFIAAWPDGPKFGMEVDPDMVAQAQARYPGITFVCLRGDDAPEGQVPRNVTLWHALEHLEHPVYTLRSLGCDQREQFFQPKAHQQARLVVEVPILERGHTDDICGFFSPQHTTHFTKATLTAALLRSGWHPIAREEMAYNGYRVLCERGPRVHTMGADLRDRDWLSWYQEARALSVARVNERLAGIGVRVPILWGGGMHTECLWQSAELRKYPPAVIVDSDPQKQGGTWRGVKIESPDFLGVIRDWASTCLVISSYGSQREIVAAALTRGVPASAIVTLYDNPVVY